MSGRLPISAKEKKCVVCNAIFIQKRHFLGIDKVPFQKVCGDFASGPHFPFFTVKRDCNDDHWISEVPIPVNILHYFLHLRICKTVFKGRSFIKKY